MTKQYLAAAKHVLDNGVENEDRTGVGTLSTFGYQMRFDLNEGFPILTTKRVAWKSVVAELLWFLEGSTDERRLAEITYGKPRDELADKTTIWTANGVDYRGEFDPDSMHLGPVYGQQWREWYASKDHCCYDQIDGLVLDIKENPHSRRHILSAWNVHDIDYMALPPCHIMTQFYVRNDKLSYQVYQRSVDLFLGLPFNIASYALLTHMMAKATGLGVGELIHTSGDLHIYKNHIEQVKLQLSRTPRNLPQIIMPEINDLEVATIRELKPSDFRLDKYTPADTISAPMAV